MIPSPPPNNEARRLAALRQYDVLDTLPEQALDELTKLAAQICGVPIALISLVDENRQWFKAKVGLEVTETPREVSFCSHALHQWGVFIVPDATCDDRFSDNPLVTGDPGIRFYAGASLANPEGVTLGTLCVMDRVPRTLTEDQVQALRVLSGQVMTHLELRRQTRELQKSEERSRAIIESALDAIISIDHENRIIEFNPAAEEMFGFERAEVIGREMAEVVIPEQFRDMHRRGLKRYLETGEARVLGRRVELRAIRANGTEFPMELTATRLGQTSPPQFAAFLRDITERQLAEVALRESEERYRHLFEHNPHPMWVYDLETLGFLAVNAAAIQHYGYTKSEFLRMTIWDIRPEEDVAALLENVAKVEEGLDLAGIWRHRVKDGRTIMVEISSHTLRFDGRAAETVLAMDVTERLAAEAALRSSEANLRRAQSIAKFGSWELVLATNELRWSEEIYHIFGMPVSEFGGTHEAFMATVHPEDLVRLEEALQLALKGEARLDLEHRIVLPDGTFRWVHELAELEQDGSGKPVRLTGTVLDITERRSSDEALRESEARLYQVFRSSPVGLSIHRWADRTLVDINPAFSHLTGWPRESVIGRAVTDLGIMDEDTAGALRAQLAAGQPLRNVDVRAKTRGGEIRHFLMGTEFVELRGEKHIVSTFVDITDRKRSEARFRRLVDSNAQGVYFWNTNGEIREANEAFLRMLGFSREDLAAGALRADTLTPPGYEDLDKRSLEEIASTGICAPFEKEYFCKDGSRIPVLVGAAAFEDNPDEGVCFALDLTERKKLEQQFLRAQRMESIGTLAGGIAHDLNNVFGPIMMSLDLLRIKFPDPSSLELISILSSSTKHGSDMVRQILSFARGVEGRRMEVQVRHLLGDIEKITRETFAKDIRIRTLVPPELWTVIGDPTQLHQVLLNLCVNARDAMPQGGTLIISAENRNLDTHYAGLNPEAKPGPYVFLQVEDSGTGIPLEVVEQIFDPFFTTKELGKGTGLGLSTSMAIVKSHGGFMRVYSEPGKGAKFKVYLPAQTEVSAQAAAQAATEMPRGKGEMILVVDDEPSVRQVTKQTLEAFGYRVLLASDGAEALATFTLHRTEIAAVLTDMMMPVMDGPAVIQVLRKLNPELPIIAASGLSANGQPGGAVGIGGLGVKYFLLKPYTAETLLKALRAVLAHPQ